jgi:hypothetical protein
MAADALEAEAIRRAFEGQEEPTGWYKGQPGGYVRRYSDTLLIFLLKGAKPEKYADRMELRGSLANINLDALPDDLLARIANGEHPLSVLACAPPAVKEEALRLPPGSSEESDAQG